MHGIVVVMRDQIHHTTHCCISLWFSCGVCMQPCASVITHSTNLMYNTCTHTHAYMHTHTCNTHIHAHTHACTHMHTHMHTHMQHTHTCTHTCMHTHACTHMHTYMHAHIHAHTCTHTHTQTQNTSTAMRTSLTSTPAALQLGNVPTTISGAISTPTPPTTATTTTTTTSQTIIIIAAAAGGGGLVLVLVLVICCVCCYCCLCRRQYEYATGNNPGYHVTVQQWKEDQAHYTANRSGSMSSQASSNRGSFGVRLGRGSRGSKKSVRSRDAGDYTVENPGVFSTPL